MTEAHSVRSDAVDLLSLQEVASLTSGSDFWHTQGVERLGIPGVMVTDGPHGLRKQSADSSGITLRGALPATCFPTAAALASTWDPHLVRDVGSALGAETRAAGVGVLLGPGVNIKRHPLCGRNFEYFSEDPLLAGVLGQAIVEGIQSQGVGASVKHFACNNQETDRTRTSAEVDERPLREIYLRPFERIVRQARPWTLMTANNRVNGTYASQHHHLLTRILRGEWGFDGVVMSDWGSVYDRVAALAAGLDLEMPANDQADAEVLAAVERGALDEQLVRESAARLLTLAARTAGATAQGGGPPDHELHHQLARRAAGQGCVLLTNDGTLPLQLASGGRIALVGPFARTPRYQGAGSSQVTPTRLDNAFDTLADAVGPDVDVVWAAGFSTDADAGPEVQDALRADALALVESADTVLLFLGLPEGDEAEGADRTRFELPAAQEELVTALTEVHRRVVVVLANGSAVATAGWADGAAAVLESWLGGQAGGAAVCDVLLGQVNPSGRLAESIPLRLEDCPAHIGWPGEEGHVRYGEGVFVGYRYYDTFRRDVAFPFGHGLSYTTFDHADVLVEVSPDSSLVVRVTVTNTGDRAGREVVQVYARPYDSTVRRPAHELVGFGQITLEPGRSGMLAIEISAQDLAYWSVTAQAWVVPAGPIDVEVGASSRDIRCVTTAVLPGNGVNLPLTEFHTLHEWLADPTAGPAVRAAFGTGLSDPLPGPLADPDVLKLVGTTTMFKFAHFGMGIDREVLDRLLDGVRREPAS